MESDNTQYYDYTVKSGDSLSRIMHKMYGFLPGDTRYRESLDYLLGINPQISNPNLIYPGQAIHLGVLPLPGPTYKSQQRSQLKDLATFPTASPQNFVVDKVAPQDKDYFWALSWLEHHSPGLVVPGSIAAGATKNLLSPANTRLISEVSDLYAEFKQGDLTRGQYNYQRAAKLDKLKKNLGPMEEILFGGRTSRESIRIAKGGGIPATAHIQRHADRLGKIAKMGKYGGILLTGVGVTASCMQIANTDDRGEKNEIFVETVSSTLMGGVAGSIVGVFLVSNPIGWGAAIVLAAGSVALAYSTGKAGRWAYDKFGNRVDLVSGLGVDQICK